MRNATRTLLALLFSVAGLANGCFSCNTSDIQSWTFTVQNGRATAKCCPANGARAGSFLMWSNGSDVTAEDYFTDSEGCDGITVQLPDQPCHMQVVCRTSHQHKETELMEARVELIQSSCLSLTNLDLLRVCLNCGTHQGESGTNFSTQYPTETSTTIEGTTIKGTTIKGTTIKGTTASPSTSATTLAFSDYTIGYTSGLAAGVSLLMFSGIVIAIIIFMVAWHNKMHRRETIMHQQEQAEDVGLLSVNGIRSLPTGSPDHTPKESDVHLQGPVQQPFSISIQIDDVQPIEDFQASQHQQQETAIISSQSTDHSTVELIEDAQTSQHRTQSDDQPAIELTKDAQIVEDAALTSLPPIQAKKAIVMCSQSTDQIAVEPVQDTASSQHLQKEMSILSSQSTDQITQVKAFQTINKFMLVESKDTKTHRYVTEKDTGRMFGRSLSHPCN